MTNRALIMTVSIVAALIFYIINIHTGALLALGIGVMCEFAFWFNLFKVDKNTTNTLSDSSTKEQ